MKRLAKVLPISVLVLVFAATSTKADEPTPSQMLIVFAAADATWAGKRCWGVDVDWGAFAAYLEGAGIEPNDISLGAWGQETITGQVKALEKAAADYGLESMSPT